MIRSMLERGVINKPDIEHHREYARRIICQVQKQRDTLHGTILLEITSKESRSLQVDTHGTKDDAEVLCMTIMYGLVGLVDKTSLSTNLSGDFIVRQTGGREDGNLLTTGDRVHCVNGRDTRRNHLFGVDARIRVDGGTVDVEVIFGEHLWALVNGATRTVKDSTQHVFGHAELETVAGEFDFGLVRVCEYWMCCRGLLQRVCGYVAAPF